MPTKTIMANESAMGVVTFSWTSPSTGIRARIMWGPGMKPMVFWTSPGHPEVAREITDPGRFGWKDPATLPGRRQVAAVRALAEAYAAAFEEEMAADDDV